MKQVTGKDYGWFFDVYLYRRRCRNWSPRATAIALTLRWKVPGDKPFPMPVEVRVGDAVKTLAMADGQGSVRSPADASFTLDPHSKVLRELPQSVAFQKDMEARAKAAKRRRRRRRGEEVGCGKPGSEPILGSDPVASFTFRRRQRGTRRNR